MQCCWPLPSKARGTCVVSLNGEGDHYNRRSDRHRTHGGRDGLHDRPGRFRRGLVEPRPLQGRTSRDRLGHARGADGRRRRGGRRRGRDEPRRRCSTRARLPGERRRRRRHPSRHGRGRHQHRRPADDRSGRRAGRRDRRGVPGLPCLGKREHGGVGRAHDHGRRRRPPVGTGPPGARRAWRPA